MDKHPYHQYFFFQIDKAFYVLSKAKREKLKGEFQDHLATNADVASVSVTPYATLGFKANTTFMLWCSAANPVDLQDFVKAILESSFGQYLTLTYSYFGLIRNSEYS